MSKLFPVFLAWFFFIKDYVGGHTVGPFSTLSQCEKYQLQTLSVISIKPEKKNRVMTDCWQYIEE
ncbi:MAG: hypothetical protein MJA29_00115 [Candidatus Omnitrophica bacterium]|nr:hypothetical protein [Candidatus Omnitrophota bacterium]